MSARWFHVFHRWRLVSRTPIAGTVNASLYWRCSCGKEKVELGY